jgi:hypothetical protein
MNTTPLADNLADVPWPTSDHRMPVPDTSMLPGSEKAAPPLQALDDGVAAAAAAIETTAERSAETLDTWVESMRTQIRSNPLATVAAAIVLGVVIARITR